MHQPIRPICESCLKHELDAVETDTGPVWLCEHCDNPNPAATLSNLGYDYDA